MTLYNKKSLILGKALLSLIAFFGCCGIWVQRAALADSSLPQQRIFAVPYTPLQGASLPLVSVSLNNRTNATFIIDTGTNGNLLTDTLARQLGLVPQPAIKNGKPYPFNGEPAQYVFVDSAKMGMLTVSRLLCIIVKQKTLLSAVGQSLIGQPIDGVIGASDLSSFSVLFDNPNHQIAIFYPGQLSEQNIKDAGFDASRPVTLTTPPDDVLFSMPVHFRNGKQEGTESLLLDTGAADNYIPSSLARQLKLKPVGPEFSENLLGGSFSVRKSLVPEVEIGSLMLKDMEVEYPSDPKDKKPIVLGMRTLSRYRVLIDYASSKVYFSEAAVSAGEKDKN